MTTFRKDVATDGRHAVVEYGVSLLEDLARRDFTMNALAYHPATGRWEDPFAGALDIQRGIIRAVGRPAQRFAEDYLRVLRALRFAARFGFTIEEETWRAAIDAAPGLAGLSAERVREEWFKGLLTARALPLLTELWISSGVAQVWLPELSSGPGIAEASPEPRDPVVLTGALCRHAGTVMQRLRASGQEIERARAIDRGPQAPEKGDPTTVRRWMATVADAVDDLLLLARYRLGKPASWSAEVQGVRERREAVSRGQLALTGDDLAREGVPPGPGMGQLLGRLLDFVLEHPEGNTREALLARMKAWS